MNESRKTRKNLKNKKIKNWGKKKEGRLTRVTLAGGTVVVVALVAVPLERVWATRCAWGRAWGFCCSASTARSKACRPLCTVPRPSSRPADGRSLTSAINATTTSGHTARCGGKSGAGGQGGAAATTTTTTKEKKKERDGLRFQQPPPVPGLQSGARGQ